MSTMAGDDIDTMYDRLMGQGGGGDAIDAQYDRLMANVGPSGAEAVSHDYGEGYSPAEPASQVSSMSFDDALAAKTQAQRAAFVGPRPERPITMVGMPTQQTAQDLRIQQVRAQMGAAAEGVYQQPTGGIIPAAMARLGAGAASGLNTTEQGWRDLVQSAASGQPAIDYLMTGQTPAPSTPFQQSVANNAGMLTRNLGLTPEDQTAMEAGGAAASRDHPIAAFTADLVAMPFGLLEPKAIAAMMVSHGLTSGIMGSQAMDKALGAVAQRAGLETAVATKSLLTGAVGVGGFTGVHTGLSGGTLPESLTAAGEGALMGAGLAVPGAATGAAGMGLAAFREARARARRFDDIQVARGFRDAGQAITRRMHTTPERGPSTARPLPPGDIYPTIPPPEGRAAPEASTPAQTATPRQQAEAFIRDTVARRVISGEMVGQLREAVRDQFGLSARKSYELVRDIRAEMEAAGQTAQRNPNPIDRGPDPSTEFVPGLGQDPVGPIPTKRGPEMPRETSAITPRGVEPAGARLSREAAADLAQEAPGPNPAADARSRVRPETIDRYRDAGPLGQKGLGIPMPDEAMRKFDANEPITPEEAAVIGLSRSGWAEYMDSLDRQVPSPPPVVEPPAGILADQRSAKVSKRGGGEDSNVTQPQRPGQSAARPSTQEPANGKQKEGQEEGRPGLLKPADVASETPAPAAGASDAAAKEPWQMTRASHLEKWKKGGWPSRKAEQTAVANEAEFYHESQIRRALAAGKPVPPEVLADYPKLTKPGERVAPVITGVNVTEAAKTGESGRATPAARHPSELTKADLQPTPTIRLAHSKDYMGEAQDAAGKNIGSLWKRGDGKVVVVDVSGESGGRPIADKALPGVYEPRDFKLARTTRLSATQTERSYRFRTPEEGAKGSATAASVEVPEKAKFSKPIKGKTGSEIVGYEWRSTRGEKWSDYEGGIINAKVSDWERAAKSELSGRDIVHVFYVRDAAGKISQQGINSAQKMLGITEARLRTIADREAIARAARMESEKRETAGLEKLAADTPEQALAQWRERNKLALAQSDRSADTALLEKGGKYIRAMKGESPGSHLQLLQQAGWKEVGASKPSAPEPTAKPVAPESVKPQKGPETQPKRAATLPERRPFSKADLEARIVSHAGRYAGMFDGIEKHERTVNADYETSAGQGLTTGFNMRYRGDKMPTELAEWTKTRPHLRKFFSKAKPGQTTWEDVAAEVGWDKYTAMVEELAGSEFKASRATLEKMKGNDPEAEFLLAVHDNLPDGRLPPKELRTPEQLATGSTFEINGEKFMVLEAEGGYRVLKDGNDYPVIPIEALSEVPVDKGTLKQPKSAPRGGAPVVRTDGPRGVFSQDVAEPVTGRQNDLIMGHEGAKEIRPERTGDDAKIAAKFDEKATPGMFGEQRGEIPDFPAQGYEFSSPAGALTLKARGFTSDVRPAEPMVNEAGKVVREPGRPISPPNVRTVVQDARNRPKGVESELNALARARRDGKATAEGLSFRGIMADLSRALNMAPPGVGKAAILRKWALGFFVPRKQDIRNIAADAYRTHAHEIGHYLHEVLFPAMRNMPGAMSSKVFPRSWNKELLKLGKELYGERKPNAGYASEGWAETMRYLMIDPARLKRKAPTVYNGVVNMLVKEHPEIWNAMMRFRLQVKTLEESGSPVRAYMFDRKNAAPPTVRNALDSFRTAFFDRFQRALTFKRDLGFNDMPAHQDPHTAALRTHGRIGGHVKLLLERGRFDPADPTARVTGKSLKDILMPVRDRLDDWQEYMIAKRAIEKRAQGFGGTLGTVTDEALKKTVEKFEAEKGFKRAADDFQEFNEWLIRDYAVHYGLIDAKQAEQIISKNLNYITFRYATPQFRDALRAPGSGSQRAFANQSSGIQRFKSGSGEEVLDPLGSFIASVQGIVTRAQLNQTARKFTAFWDRDAGGIGRWMSEIEHPMKAVKVQDSQFQRAVRKELEPALEGLTKEDRDALLETIEEMSAPTFFEKSFQADDATRTMSVMQGGKRRWFEIKDQRLYDMLKGLTNPGQIDPWMSIMTIPARVLRAGATGLNPEFFIPNFLRDTFQALTMTGAKRGTMPARLRGMAESFKSGDVERMFLSSGADMEGLFGKYVDPKTGRANVNDLFEPPTVLRMIQERDVKNLAREAYTLGLLRRMNAQFERTTRYGEFEAVRSGRTTHEGIRDAGQAAADVTLDFTRGGSLGMAVNRVVPFFNAAMQGGDKLARFVSQHPVKAAVNIATYVVAPSMLSLWMNRNNEDYWSIPQRLRDTYWWFPIGKDEHGEGHFVKIPKPRGLGMFAIAAERGYSRVLGINPETGEPGGDPGAGRGVAGRMVQELAPPVTVAGITPLLEVWSNHSFFTGKPIVSRRDQDLPAEAQGAERSSDLARIMGRTMGYAPAKIDHLIRGYTGGLGRTAVQMGLDPVLRAVTGETQKTPKGNPMTFEDYAVVRTFMGNTGQMEHEAVARFYDDYDDVAARWRDYRRIEDPDKAAEYERRHGAELDRYQDLNPTYKAVSDLWKQRREVLNDPDIDPELRARELRMIDEEIVAEVRDSARASIPTKNRAAQRP